ncbi:MAG: site-specific integrase [Akkermansiaceae bacterium]|nr:site-specific integrase [Akkermansiaceae bacterium]
MQAHGIRRKLKLKSSIKDEASREAASLWNEVLANGWPPIEVDADATEPAEKQELPLQPQEVTVGEWIQFVSSTSHTRPETISKYAESLRTIVGEMLDLKRRRSAGTKARILGTGLDLLTKPAIQKWIDQRLAKARLLDPVRQRRAQNTVRALLRNARGLFGNQILELESAPPLPFSPPPFQGIRPPAKSSSTYVSRFNAVALLTKARAELSAPPSDAADPEEVIRFEQWKIVYLALVAGLRYNEIDRLMTRDISRDEGKINVRLHEGFTPKTGASEGQVLVGEEARQTIAVMLDHTQRGWFLKASPSNRTPRYRAGLSHDATVSWLRAYEENGDRPFAGVHKPIHELRKEAGTLVNSQHGLIEAKTFLRHGSIATTAAYYVGTKGTITTGLG